MDLITIPIIYGQHYQLTKSLVDIHYTKTIIRNITNYVVSSLANFHITDYTHHTQSSLSQHVKLDILSDKDTLAPLSPIPLNNNVLIIINIVKNPELEKLQWID
eukprot:486084_1